MMFQMKLISPYVEVVHICQGQLDHEAALWPYLAVQVRALDNRESSILF